ncbi:F-box only protein 15 [Triplophysa dalaica]|uniref:F-box only protein 15 n=1 Tax=Triplophysa dalaica TaxID=1582913 RepID=UPI0024DF5634|nr:F-box only protein 15 [Triplophysa dalaica]
MANVTSLGEFFKSLKKGVERVEQTSCKDIEVKVRRMAQSANPKRWTDTSVQSLCSLENYLDRLPAEVLLKIFAFLDASTLFNISFVNKRFHDLANNNALWYVLYACEIEKRRWRPRVCMASEAVSTTGVHKPVGYWKKLLFKEMAGYQNNMWKSELRHMNPHTGMPALTEQVLRRLHIQWEITLTGKNGHESVYEQTRTFFEDSSVTVCWNHGKWPQINRVHSLQLHGIMRPAVLAPGDRPTWRSLIHKTLLNAGHWSFLGADRHVKLLQFDEGIVVGFWRGNWKIAFIMVTLHFHKLIERSLLGSRFCPYVLTQDSAFDPDCDQHGYTLHVVLHNPVQRILRCRFSPLFMSRATSLGDSWQLSAIDFTDVSEHIPVGKISLPWQTEGLHEAAERCCMMTLTVLDEGQRPFWCVSSPVKMHSKKYRLVDLDYEGEQLLLFYMDADGKVKMTFVFVEEFQQYFLVQLNVIFPAAKVSKHVGGEC